MSISPAQLLVAMGHHNNRQLHLGVAAMLIEHLGRRGRPTRLVLPLDAVEGRPVRVNSSKVTLPVHVTVRPGTPQPPGLIVQVHRTTNGTIDILVDRAVSIHLSDGGDGVLHAILAPASISSSAH